MRSKDLAKAAGLAEAFDHTAPTFYRVSRTLEYLDYLGDKLQGTAHRATPCK